MTETLILHEYALSGNCYKIRLTAAHVGATLQRREYDILQGETRTADFLGTVNANGRIPVLQIGDRFLPESNAACFWLADSSPLIPVDRFDRADMLRWMNWEQYNHEPNVATMRFLRAFLFEENWSPEQRASVPMRTRNGDAALALMDDHLATRQWFVGKTPTVADLCLYPYTSTAGEGAFDLTRYPHVSRWLDDVAALPGHVTIIA
ncbi:glutathione S-transferase family protein [Sphingomonas sp.]|uniref:glutathione S-transferase family protein n=1 Tax=Sphingomonas sp. TaxID=28214 RepID=UPI0025F10EAA|nr:glutathione S-transferase family protein [Sphingomonas sp.]